MNVREAREPGGRGAAPAGVFGRGEEGRGARQLPGRTLLLSPGIALNDRSPIELGELAKGSGHAKDQRDRLRRPYRGGAAAGTFRRSVLGITITWDIAETKAAFAKAGIRETDFGKDAALKSGVTDIAETWLDEVSPYLKSNCVIFEMMDPGNLPKPQ